MTDQAQSPSEEKAAWWEDYLEIFFAPSRVFARRAGSGFLVPFVVLAVISAVIALGLRSSFQPAIEADAARGMEIVRQQNPDVTAEQIAQGMAIQEKIVGVVILIATPLFALLMGLTLWIFGKFVGATETLKQAMLIATLASFPRILGVLAGGIQGMMLPEASLNGINRMSLGPARFLDPDTASTLSVALANRFDLTLIWITILLAIGLKVIAKIPMSKAMVAAVLVWVVAGLLPVIGALRAGG